MQVYGNIATDPQRRIGNAGKPFFTFRLLESNGTRENPKEPTGYSVAYFPSDEMDGDVLKKGMRLKVTGRVEPSSYVDANQQTRLDLRLTTNLVEIQARREDQGQGSAAPAARPAAAPAQRPAAAPAQRPAASENPAATRAVSGFDDMDDDIPF